MRTAHTKLAVLPDHPKHSLQQLLCLAAGDPWSTQLLACPVTTAVSVRPSDFSAAENPQQRTYRTKAIGVTVTVHGAVRHDARMAATDLSQLSLPAAADEWLKQVDAREAIFDQRFTVHLQWWEKEFADHRMRGTLLGTSISRGDLFAIADDALNSPHAALQLLWNSIAWGSGTGTRNIRTRIDAVADNEAAAGQLLQRPAHASRVDPQAAYELLYPGNKAALRGLGPAFFTKYLYFAGAGAAVHPCCILDERVALALRAIGWKSLPTQQWWPSAYKRYNELLQRWAGETAAPRFDLIERWLFDKAGNAAQ